MTHQPISKIKQDSVMVISKELSPLVDRALALEITSAKEMEEATEILSQLNIKNDRIKAEKETITKPAKAIIDRENERWEPLVSMYKSAIAHIRPLMSDYQTQETLRLRAEEKKIADRIGSGKGKLSIETGVAKIAELERPEEKVSTDSGSLSFREDQVLKITDEFAIPREYLIVNEKEVLIALKAGKVVPGAEIEIKMVPINRRK